jgi:2-succinyl-5-enolpyruvyl-6-hydroxy-3-cyclohexene-1-carboxylate synthase
VCLAPGSRHTALVLAFAKHEKIKKYSHLDERSAAFFALGMALASDEPVALVCTSGTAAANFFPAIIEAHQSRVPLIVITADRPPELRHSGANQTIDQIKMYGDYVLWFVDAALPEANPPAVAIRYLRTLAARAYATANGIRKGVVHINMPFRKPLEPTPVEGDVVDVSEGAEAREDGSPYTQCFTAGIEKWLTNSKTADSLRRIVTDNPNGVIICGGGAPASEAMIQALSEISQICGYPLLAEAYSRTRRRGDMVHAWRL